MLLIIIIDDKLFFFTTGHTGKWSVSEGSILSINEDTGVAMATATGRTVVYHKLGGVVDTLTEVRHY